ncbi:Uncharacterised protein [Mycobacterium tuberculosis]|nr:Uncharacterised protein [Mycobacterium tuberculosis]
MPGRFNARLEYGAKGRMGVEDRLHRRADTPLVHP